MRSTRQNTIVTIITIGTIITIVTIITIITILTIRDSKKDPPSMALVASIRAQLEVESLPADVPLCWLCCGEKGRTVRKEGIGSFETAGAVSLSRMKWW